MFDSDTQTNKTLTTRLLVVASVFLLISSTRSFAETTSDTSKKKVSKAEQPEKKKTPSKPSVVPLPLVSSKLIITLQYDAHHAEADQVKQWKSDLQRRLENSFGQTLQLSIHSRDQSVTTKERIPVLAPAPDSIHELSQTHLYFSLHDDGSNWHVQTRYWLALTEQWRELPEQTLKNENAVPRTLARLSASVVQPIVRIKKVDFDQVTGELIGGEFFTSDDSVRMLGSGDLFGVIMIYYTRDRKPKSRQILPWTYLKVTDRQRAVVSFSVASAFRSPIPRSKRRVEILAYRINANYPQCEARVLVRSKSNRPYRLTKVFLSPWEKPVASPKTQADQKEDVKEPPIPHVVLTTSRLGKFDLDKNALRQKLGNGLVKVEVMSVDAVVARVPWFPGSTDQLEIVVPDDSARLVAQLRLAQLKTELLRVSAKRATLLAALKQLADNPQEVDPSPFFEEIKKLPTQKFFLRQLDLIRVPATDDLTSKGNRTAARDVKKLCEATKGIIERQFNNESIEELKLRLGYKEKPEGSEEK